MALYLMRATAMQCMLLLLQKINEQGVGSSMPRFQPVVVTGRSSSPPPAPTEGSGVTITIVVAAYGRTTMSVTKKARNQRLYK